MAYLGAQMTGTPSADRPDRVDEMLVSQPPSLRMEFIDLLRGLIICLMALDHVRDFVNRDALLFDPLDVHKTTVWLYFTRWATHLCAPTFVLLSGVSIFLQAQKGKTGWALSRFLLTRGLWLIFLEVTVVDCGFDFAFGMVVLQVIYAIGLSMVVMAALIHLPRLAVLAIGLAIVAGHNLLDGLTAAHLGQFGLAWHLLMQFGFVPPALLVMYPAVPWLGIMCIGYGAGPLYVMEASKRTRTMIMIGAAMIALFVVLRLPNLYGDVRPWVMPDDHGRAFMAVLDVSKYPPSLDYVLITLGITTLLGVAVQWAPKALKTVFLAFGRTPLLTYLLHLYVAHTLALIIGVFMRVPAADFFGLMEHPQLMAKDGWGLPLWGTYLVWLSVLAILYPISSAYAKYRATHRHGWQSYL
jgi:uncharacterized membrane protein